MGKQGGHAYAVGTCDAPQTGLGEAGSYIALECVRDDDTDGECSSKLVLIPKAGASPFR
jgi:hypothetical protein